MALTCNGTFFCSTSAAITGTEGLRGGAALVPVHEFNNMRTAHARTADAPRRSVLANMIAMFLFSAIAIITTIAVIEFLCPL